ncbi:hypothetical protein I4U23_012643 [Adineta vaga]|nr:hypothetical protein I4U23_012643 [Adineta vaga]
MLAERPKKRDVKSQQNLRDKLETEVELANFPSVSTQSIVPVASVIQTGKHLASQGNYRDAIHIFNGISPPTFESLYYCGCARLELGDRIEVFNAIDNFNQALNLSPCQQDSNLYYKRAFAFQLVGRYVEAILDYTTYIEKNHHIPAHQGYLSRGLVYNDIKEYHKALDDIKFANQFCPLPSKYYLYCLGQAQFLIGQNSDAQQTFSNLAKLCKNEFNTINQSFDSFFYYGIAQYELGDYPDALKYFREALEYVQNKKHRTDTIFNIGLTAYACGDMDLAKTAFTDVIQLDENHAKAKFRLGMMLNQDDRSYNEALNLLTEAHKLAPHRSDILYERGELYYKLGQLGASIQDKRLALQLQHTEIDPSILKNQYELLKQQLLSKIKSPSTLPNVYLLFAILSEKSSMPSQNGTKKHLSNGEYRRLISYYDQAIEKDPCSLNTTYTFALRYQLHKDKKHYASAMINLDQFNDVLDKYPNIEKSWNEMLIGMTKKQNISQSGDLHSLLEMEDIKKFTQTMDEKKINDMVMTLLNSKFQEFTKINSDRNKVKLDEDSFADDQNQNRRIFYRKMRASLSHKFTAMAVTSGDDENDPLVKHDRTGTTIADGLGYIADIVGTVVPVGGELITFAAGQISNKLKDHEYGKYQTRMSHIIEDRDILELNDLARRVARELTDRYKNQLLNIASNFDSVVPTRSCCHSIFPCKNKVKPTDTATELNLIKRVTEFGIAFAIQSILNGNFSIRTTPDDLYIDLVELICRAEPTLSKKIRQRLRLKKNEIISYIPSKDNQEIFKPWYLYDFYRKPGIYLKEENETMDNQQPLPWMDVDLYGFRLGTREELNNLIEFDKKQPKKKIRKYLCCCLK